MNIIPTAIPGVLIIESNVYGDVRGFFFERFNPKAFHQAIGQDVQFGKTTTAAVGKGCCEACPIKYDKPSVILCAWCVARYSMWRWTSAKARQLSGNGWVWNSRKATIASSGYLPVPPTAMWH